MVKSGNRGSDEAFYQLVKAAGQAILKLVGVATVDGYHFHADTLKAKRVSPDMVAIPLTGLGDTVIMEFQGYHDPLIRYRLAATVALFCSQEKKVPAILPAIIFTEHSFAGSALPLDISDSTGQYQLRGKFKEIVLENYTEEQLLTLDPRLVALVPYTLPKNMPKNELSWKVLGWGNLIRELYPQKQSLTQIDLLALILLNRFRHLSIEEVTAMLNLDITDTVAGQQLINLGDQRGSLRIAREDIIEILEARFGQVPREVIDATNELDDLPGLKALLKASALVNNLDEFIQTLRRSKN
ncbi:MAG: DUF2887 domain-containing protein [Deltaproteobacteria bacterium]|nr:DUF2887 domain-containing protein [Deltaproteobacteria bacterium]MBF0526903.1 DUF2887 domain-containing protein [Deltaproteobacteria bacterium]